MSPEQLARVDIAPRARWGFEGVIVGAVWLLVFVMAASQYLWSPHEHAGPVGGWVAQELVTYGTWALVTPLVFWFGRRFPLWRGRSWRRLGLYLAVGLAVASGVSSITVFAHDVLTHAAGLRQALTEAAADFRIWPPISELITFAAIAAMGLALDVFRENRDRRLQTERLHAQLSEARLNALRMQLNPHFLFNALNAVSGLVEQDPRAARRVLARLGALLRRTLDEKRSALVPLSAEIRFLEDYLAVVEARLGDRVVFQRHVDAEVLDALVPDLILQPLVENAVEHAGAAGEEATRIELRAAREGALLVLVVRDNGPGLRAPGAEDGGRHPTGGVGLANTRARLLTLYGAEASLTLLGEPQGGLRAEVRVPYSRAAAVDRGPTIESGAR